MPWTGKSYRARHNKSLSPAQASKAAAQANAMLREGVPEGIAIATANKHAAGKSAGDRMKNRYGAKKKRD
jgi:uncharacterized protein YdaT